MMPPMAAAVGTAEDVQQRGQLRAEPVGQRARQRGRAAGQGQVRGLRRLPRRRRQGQPGAGRAQPDRQGLAARLGRGRHRRRWSTAARPTSCRRSGAAPERPSRSTCWRPTCWSLSQTTARGRQVSCAAPGRRRTRRPLAEPCRHRRGRGEPATTRRRRSSRCTQTQKKIYPRAVSGWFASWRWALVWVTQLVFYGLPWLQWNDRQAVLFDLGARRFYIFGLVLYPQDFIYLTGAADHLGLRAVPVHRGGRAAVVRLCLPADGLHRDLHVGRAQARGRPHRAHEARRRRPGAPTSCWRKGGQAAGLDRHRRCGPASPSSATSRRSSTLAGRGRTLALGPWEMVLGPVLRLRHLRQRRLHARAGLQVHVPLRALPERDVRQGHADHQLRRRARRAARLALAARPTQGRWAWATASTAACACRSAPPASTSARACSTSASAAPPASTSATA